MLGGCCAIFPCPPGDGVRLSHAPAGAPEGRAWVSTMHTMTTTAMASFMMTTAYQIIRDSNNLVQSAKYKTQVNGLTQQLHEKLEILQRHANTGLPVLITLYSQLLTYSEDLASKHLEWTEKSVSVFRSYINPPTAFHGQIYTF